jgi:pimeloyl-[acyl-carrier protein] methyl ester esterase
MHIESTGHGPDLILLHGWGMHGGVWDGVRDGLAQRFRVHAVDLPGYGASSASAPITLERMADALAQTFPQPVHVCGWSLGGAVALTWALRCPEQVTRLILVAATPCFATRSDWPYGVDAAVLREFEQGLQADYEGTLKRFLSLQARSGEDARAVMEQLRQTLFARGRPDPAALAAGLEILLHSDLRQQVTALKQPTLLIHGEHDTLVPLVAVEWLRDHIPQARLEVVKGCTHAPFLSHAREFMEQVTDFLA